jgi:hypothetical protein
MARPRKNVPSAVLALPPALNLWAEAIGDAIGRGMVRALHNSGLGAVGGGNMVQARRRGRPPKVQPGQPVPPDRMCRMGGCGRPARSKGLCSAHYQAERRRVLAMAANKNS